MVLTSHAIKRFRQRVLRVPHRRAEALLLGIVSGAALAPDGETPVRYGGRDLIFVARGGTLVTIKPAMRAGIPARDGGGMPDGPTRADARGARRAAPVRRAHRDARTGRPYRA